MGRFNTFKLSGQRDRFQGVSEKVIVEFCLDEEGYPGYWVAGKQRV